MLFRSRESHRILGGTRSPDQWLPFETVADSTAIPLPRDLAPGDYHVTVRMLRTPHYPNTRLVDYFSDADAMHGPAVARVTVEPARSEAAR